MQINSWEGEILYCTKTRTYIDQPVDESHACSNNPDDDDIDEQANNPRPKCSGRVVCYHLEWIDA